MTVKVGAIIQDALGVIGEVTGSGTQQYSEDRVRQDVVRAFNMLFKKYAWEQYRDWFTIVLDGVIGISTTDAFTFVRDFDDFLAVHRDKEVHPLPSLSTSVNPNTLATAGTRPLYWTSLPVTHANYEKRKIRVYPETSIGSLNVLARIYPKDPITYNWADDDDMHLDRDMLAFGTAFATLAGDDLNPAAATVAQNMMEDRFKTIMKALARHPIPIKGTPNIPLGGYWERP